LNRDVLCEIGEATLIFAWSADFTGFPPQLSLTADQDEHVFTIGAQLRQQIEIGLNRGPAPASPPLALVATKEFHPQRA
jgi:hypothetical protein